MARDRNDTSGPAETVISIIGPGMTIVGDCETDGTIRVEGTIEGSITAGKAVVIGKEGVVKGDVRTQDAVISGRLEGSLFAESRLELQATCQIDGEVHTRRMQLEEGAVLNGTVHMGADAAKHIAKSTPVETKPTSGKEEASAKAGAPQAAG